LATSSNDDFDNSLKSIAQLSDETQGRENKLFPWNGAVLELRTLPFKEALRVLKATKL
jgi:hypothetical protein